MKCESVLELIALYDDDVLTDEERMKVDEHLENCEPCRAALDDFRDIAMMLADLPPVEPPAELKERVYKKLQEELKNTVGEPPALKKKNHKFPFWLGGMVASVLLLVAFANSQGYLNPFFDSGATDKLVASTAAVGTTQGDVQLKDYKPEENLTIAAAPEVKDTDGATPDSTQADPADVNPYANRSQERQEDIQKSNQILSRNGISTAEHNSLDSERQMMMAASAPVTDTQNAVSDEQYGGGGAMKRSLTLTENAAETTGAAALATGYMAAVAVTVNTRQINGTAQVALNDACSALGIKCDIRSGEALQTVYAGQNGESKTIEGIWQDGQFMVKPERLAGALNMTVNIADSKAVFKQQ